MDTAYFMEVRFLSRVDGTDCDAGSVWRVPLMEAIVTICGEVLVMVRWDWVGCELVRRTPKCSEAGNVVVIWMGRDGLVVSGWEWRFSWERGKGVVTAVVALTFMAGSAADVLRERRVNNARMVSLERLMMMMEFCF